MRYSIEIEIDPVESDDLYPKEIAKIT